MSAHHEMRYLLIDCAFSHRP